MRAKSMGLILVALACGLVATIGVSQVMKENAQTDAAPQSPIVVTVANLDIGDAIKPEQVKVEQWPQEKVPPGAITSLEEIEGKYARQYMFPGEPLLSGKLMDSNRDLDSAKIPPGYRVAAVKVDDESAVANLINPGDHVDVIAYIKARGEQGVQTQTILRNVRVFAVNSETSRGKEMADTDRIDAKTISLLVKPAQVQLVVLAEQLGKVELSLRHPDEKDRGDDVDGPTTITDLVQGRNSSDRGGAPAGGLTGILNTIVNPPVAPAQRGGETFEPTGQDEPFQMVVLTPQEATVWKWDDERQLPTLADETSNGPAAQAAPAEAAPALPVPALPGVAPTLPVPAAPATPTTASPFVGEA